MGYAVAIAGFETSCSQKFYSLVVDIVEPQSENTRLRMVIDFRNKNADTLTTWTRVKLSYLVTSAQRISTNIPNAYIWATSQSVDLTQGPITSQAFFTDPIFTSTTGNADDFTRGQGCGLNFDNSNNKYRFGIRCD